ncbi:MAG TPA: hypothetical protein VJQ83_09285 [Tepidiformaceae bacterium]|nr:hypothetical protein [Tepidiformaceae bacterium]
MLSPAASLTEELSSRLRQLYGARFVALYACAIPVYAHDDEAADYDFVVVLRGAVRPGQEIVAMSNDVSDVSLEFNCVICVFAIGLADVTAPHSLAMARALDHAARVA